METARSCKKCGEYRLYRSRSKNIFEKIIKKILPLRTYRCHNCNWRGFLVKREERRNKNTGKFLAFYLLVVIIAIITAYMLRSTFQ